MKISYIDPVDGGENDDDYDDNNKLVKFYYHKITLCVNTKLINMLI